MHLLESMLTLVVTAVVIPVVLTQMIEWIRGKL